jgi:hypothetical protein
VSCISVIVGGILRHEDQIRRSPDRTAERTDPFFRLAAAPMHDKKLFDGKMTDISPKFERQNVTEAQQCDISQKGSFCEWLFMVDLTGRFICFNVLLAALLRAQQVQQRTLTSSDGTIYPAGFWNNGAASKKTGHSQ